MWLRKSTKTIDNPSYTSDFVVGMTWLPCSVVRSHQLISDCPTRSYEEALHYGSLVSLERGRGIWWLPNSCGVVTHNSMVLGRRETMSTQLHGRAQLHICWHTQKKVRKNGLFPWGSMIYVKPLTFHLMELQL